MQTGITNTLHTYSQSRYIFPAKKFTSPIKTSWLLKRLADSQVRGCILPNEIEEDLLGRHEKRIHIRPTHFHFPGFKPSPCCRRSHHRSAGQPLSDSQRFPHRFHIERTAKLRFRIERHFQIANTRYWWSTKAWLTGNRSGTSWTTGGGRRKQIDQVSGKLEKTSPCRTMPRFGTPRPTKWSKLID